MSWFLSKKKLSARPWKAGTNLESIWKALLCKFTCNLPSFWLLRLRDPLKITFLELCSLKEPLSLLRVEAYEREMHVRSEMRVCSTDRDVHRRHNMQDPKRVNFEACKCTRRRTYLIPQRWLVTTNLVVDFGKWRSIHIYNYWQHKNGWKTTLPDLTQLHTFTV